MLHQLLTKYARIAFATTTYGYEGTGRGFAIKFQETLNLETPGWHDLEMNLPIRWAPHDPVESFVFRCLCLDAKVDRFDSTIDPTLIVYERLDRDKLIEDENLLSAIFGLLVLAHYQTQPRDLRYLLDAINLDIFVAKHNNTIIGTAVVEQEGGLDESTAQTVYRNERRVTGHLLPQTLESFVGIKSASTAKYLRIVRIAVLPELRRKGIGQQLLKYIESDSKNSGLDIIGTNFGASSDLLAFWHSAGYLPTHIGLKHNTNTATNAVTYLKPLSNNGQTIYQTAINKLKTQFTFQLPEGYQTLDADVVAGIYGALTTEQKLQLTLNEWDDITSFAESLRGYEINALPIHKLVHHGFANGAIGKTYNKKETHLLIKKVLQRQSWQETVVSLDIAGKQQAIQALRKVIGTLINDTSLRDSITIETNS